MLLRRFYVTENVNGTLCPSASCLMEFEWLHTAPKPRSKSGRVLKHDMCVRHRVTLFPCLTDDLQTARLLDALTVPLACPDDAVNSVMRTLARLPRSDGVYMHKSSVRRRKGRR
jgi:hypothetical protein